LNQIHRRTDATPSELFAIESLTRRSPIPSANAGLNDSTPFELNERTPFEITNCDFKIQEVVTNCDNLSRTLKLVVSPSLIYCDSDTLVFHREHFIRHF
jgi:hypothetical protein